MAEPMTEPAARAYLDLSFTPLKAAIETRDKVEIARIVKELKDDGRADLADIALDTVAAALYPSRVAS
jgi:hypothetical protein